MLIWELELFARVVVAGICGAAIGYERQNRIHKKTNKKPLEPITQGVKYLEGIIPFSLYSLPCKIIRPPIIL